MIESTLTPNERSILEIAQKPPPRNYVLGKGEKRLATLLERRGLLTVSFSRCEDVIFRRRLDQYDLELTAEGRAALKTPPRDPRRPPAADRKKDKGLEEGEVRPIVPGQNTPYPPPPPRQNIILFCRGHISAVSAAGERLTRILLMPLTLLRYLASFQSTPDMAAGAMRLNAHEREPHGVRPLAAGIQHPLAGVRNAYATVPVLFLPIGEFHAMLLGSN